MPNELKGKASRHERTGKGEEDNLLVLPLLGGVVVDGDTARGDVSLLLRPGDVAVMRGNVNIDILKRPSGGEVILTRRQRPRGKSHRAGEEPC